MLCEFFKHVFGPNFKFLAVQLLKYEFKCVFNFSHDPISIFHRMDRDFKTGQYTPKPSCQFQLTLKNCRKALERPSRVNLSENMFRKGWEIF